MTHKIFYPLLVLGTFTILTGCFDPADYELQNRGTEIDLSPADTTIVANGVSKASIKFHVIEEVPTKHLPIIFKTTAGSFVGGEGDSLVVQPSVNYEATIRFISTSEGPAKITAKIGGVVFDKTATVNCTKAYPDKVSVLVDSIAIRNSFSSEIIINASLSRSTGGVASSGHPVEFVAYTDDGIKIGYYLNNQNIAYSNSSGMASIRFTVGDTSYTGELRIVASTETQNGSATIGETFLQVID